MRLVTSCLILFHQAAVAQEARSPAVALEHGVFTETVLGDVPKAIEIYSQVQKDTSPQSESHRQATLRLAECHEVSEHWLMAWITYHQLPENGMAQEQKVDLMIRLAEEETAYSATLLHHIGDVFLGLDGALNHNESERILTLTQELATLAGSLTEQASGLSDEHLLHLIERDSTRWRTKEDLVEFRDQSYTRAFLNREALADFDDVFGYALERMDEVWRALNAGNSVTALEALESFKTYLSPLDPWPTPDREQGTRNTYLLSLQRLASDLEPRIGRNELASARLILDKFAQHQAAHDGMIHWHIDESIVEAFNNPEVLPHYAAALVCLESMLGNLAGGEIDAAKTHLNEAVSGIENLQQLKANTSEEMEASIFLQQLTEALDLLEDGETDTVMEIFSLEDGEGS